MSKGQVIAWKRLFDHLASNGLFTGTIADQIALLYVYMPLVRREVYEFVKLWNIHTIRKQKQRPYLPTGKPVVIYFTPPEETPTFTYNVLDTRPDVAALLSRLQSDVEYWDPDEYLPEETMSWCAESLRIAGIETITLELAASVTGQFEQEGRGKTALDAYLSLRAAAAQFIQSGGVLHLSKRPSGAYSWTPDNIEEFDLEDEVYQDIADYHIRVEDNDDL